MTRLYRIARFILVSLLLFTVGIPIVLYLLLWLPPVQQRISAVATDQLTQLLGTDIAIGSLQIEPFARITIHDLTVADPARTDGRPALSAGTVGCGISAFDLIARGRIVITDVELIDVHTRISRKAPGEPLNIAPILTRLRSDTTRHTDTRFALAINTAVIRRAALAYDVTSMPAPEVGRFSPHHIGVTDLKADVALPTLRNDHIRLQLKRLSFHERSGFTLRELHASAEFTDTLLQVTDLRLQLPGSSLHLGDVSLPYPSPGELLPSVMDRENELAILPPSHIYPPDLAMFVPQLAAVATRLDLRARLVGTPDSVVVHRLSVTSQSGLLSMDTRASAKGLLHPATELEADVPQLSLQLSGPQLLTTLTAVKEPKPQLAQILTAAGQIALTATATVTTRTAAVEASLLTDIGSARVEACATHRSGRITSASGTVQATGLDLALLTGNRRLGPATFSGTVAMNRNPRGHVPYNGSADITARLFTFNSHPYHDIDLRAELTDDNASLTLDLADPMADISASATARLTPGEYAADLTAAVSHARLHDAGLIASHPGHSLNANMRARYRSASQQWQQAAASLVVSQLNFVDSTDHGIHLAPITLTVNTEHTPNALIFESPVVQASATGSINPSTLLPALASLLPLDTLGFTPPAVPASAPATPNDLSLKVKILDAPEFFSFIKPPVVPIYPVEITADLRESLRRARLSIQAPYLRQGNKMISRTALTLSVDTTAVLSAITAIPTKDGNNQVSLHSRMGRDGIIATTTDWRIERAADFHGHVALDTRLLPDPHHRSRPGGARVELRPGLLVFNDTAWTIHPATVTAALTAPMRIDVDHLLIGHESQQVAIDGSATADSSATLTVDLRGINLDYLFETLNISDAIVFGGTAHGTVTAKALLSPQPQLATDHLYVENISYNHCRMGNADIAAGWDNATKGIRLHADITQANDRHAIISGSIFPMKEALDLTFRADHTPVGFLQPFMKAFASEVGGAASGTAHLFGTFKLVDMTGRLMAEDFSLKLDQTGVTYHATDSVTMLPGRIDISRLTLRDAMGHTAELNGRLTHTYFKEPCFNFQVTRARNLLVFDQPPSDLRQWSGRIFGSGTVGITGRPGLVDITANVSTDPNSTFEFTLSDALQAGDYTFITFRDRNATQPLDTARLTPGSPEMDRVMSQRVNSGQQLATSSTYNMSLNLDVTPNTRMILVMDPSAGDKITAYGSGHASVLYSSANDEFRIFGDYTIRRGTYNFTLQDIIIRNFTLVDGSSVSFTGDLDKTRLDINAIYALKANLADLDESFLNDKEVGRTNVTVNALLQVDGNITNPEINFDLQFPTLTSDVERKVHSIVSTKEMMNRQIIYLLALNRFYTPEYMGSSAQGGELMSVASSTLSSQLSNMLGQLSDKFSLAPTLRSNTGDFSDVEFDVALSSALLNNRLILNGNFGYRDKALNNNQFVGDFDIEYLLNRIGSWRLKAYNHFNDRNLYVRSALTTQGIGLVFRHDFNSLLRHPGRKPAAVPRPADSAADSTAIKK